MAKEIKQNRKMTAADIQLILGELKRWESKEFGSGLTWARLEEFSGFSKQALFNHSEIKVAFQQAKGALANPDRKSRARQKEEYSVYLEGRIGGLEKDLAKYKALEETWLARWQRIAYHAKTRGIDIDDLDQPLPTVARR